MSAKTYTLELTAEELDGLGFTYCYVGDEPPPAIEDVGKRLDALRAEAKADRERDELRLPWRMSSSHPYYAQFSASQSNSMCVGCCKDATEDGRSAQERRAKLASAAPELLEAVQATKAWMADPQSAFYKAVGPLVDRALRKVETGVPA
jgi:hypothetical protein